jgi:hypothetical protein
VNAEHSESLSSLQLVGVAGIIALGFAIAFAIRLSGRRGWMPNRSKT